MSLPKCRYCSNPIKRLGAVVCISPECDKRRRVENAARSNANKVARLAKGEKVYVRPKEPKQVKPKTKEIDCMGRCGGRFVTKLDNAGVPIDHFCPNCRHHIYEDLRYADAWNE